MTERTRPKQSLTFQSRCVKVDLASRQSMKLGWFAIGHLLTPTPYHAAFPSEILHLNPQPSWQKGALTIFVYYMCNTVNRICSRADCIRVTGGVLGAVVPSAAVQGRYSYKVCRSTILATQPVPIADGECLSYNHSTIELLMLTVKLFVCRVHGNEQWT